MRRIVDGLHPVAVGVAKAAFGHGVDEWRVARQQEFDLLAGFNLVAAHQRDATAFVRAPRQHFADDQP